MSSWRGAVGNGGEGRERRMEGDKTGNSRSPGQVGRSRGCADWRRTMTLDCTRGGGKIKRYSVWSC